MAVAAPAAPDREHERLAGGGELVDGVGMTEVRVPRLPAALILALGISVLGCNRSKPPSPTVSAELPGLDARVHRTLAGHTAHVWSVAFSPDGQLLASGSVDRTVRLWRVGDGGLARVLAHPEGVTFVAFSPDWTLARQRQLRQAREAVARR